MDNHRSTATLCKAVLWRVWIEQRRSILLFPVLVSVLLTSIVLVAQFAPSLLTGATRAALERGGSAQLGLGRGGSLAFTFLQLQAPFLLALFAGVSAASIAQRTLGSEAERGSLEMLLATRYGIAQIGLALLVSSFAMAAFSWGLLIVFATATSQVLAHAFGFVLTMSLETAASVVAMQLVLALLAAEIATIGSLLFPGLARLRGGVSADPMQLVASAPALVLFVVANVRPELGPALLSLAGLAFGAVLLVAGLLLTQAWFRPTAFLET